MRVPAGRSGRVVPASGPAVTASFVGPLRPREDRFFFSGRAALGGAGAAPRPAALPPLPFPAVRRLTRVPYRSPRSTPTTAKTKNHISTSNPSRMTVRVSSLSTPGSPPAPAEGDRGAADRHPVAVLEVLARDPLAVDEGAVRRAEVADRRDEVRAVGGHPQLAVPPGDAGVVEDDVGAVVAAQDGDRPHQRVALAVDVEPGPVGGVGPLGPRRGGRGRMPGRRVEVVARGGRAGPPRGVGCTGCRRGAGRPGPDAVGTGRRERAVDTGIRLLARLLAG